MAREADGRVCSRRSASIINDDYCIQKREWAAGVHGSCSCRYLQVKCYVLGQSQWGEWDLGYQLPAPRPLSAARQPAHGALEPRWP